MLRFWWIVLQKKMKVLEQREVTWFTDLNPEQVTKKKEIFCRSYGTKDVSLLQ